MDVTDSHTEHDGHPGDSAGLWGRHLRTFRRAQLGLSRRDFAELVNEEGRRQRINVACSERHVARWELGEVQCPNKTYRALLSAIGAPEPGADAAPNRVDTGVDFTAAPLPRPTGTGTTDQGRLRDTTFLQALAAAVVGSPDILSPWLPRLDDLETRVETTGQPDLDFVYRATIRLREIDQSHGGSAVTDAATNLLTVTTTLLARSRGEAHEHAMLIASADLARLVGWAYHDVGDQHRAREYATLALVFARQAGADSLVASTFYVLGRISLIEHDPRTALRMFQLGQLPAQDAANGGESARLYANEAWAHAMMGDASRMEFALARAEDETTRVGDLIDPWTRVFFTPGEFNGMRSVIYNEYALTARGRAAERYTLVAIDSARASLAASVPGRPTRSILFDNITIATGAFRLGQINEAVSYANTSLELAGNVGSGRVTDRLRRMTHAATLSSPRRDVRDLCHAVGRASETASHRPRFPFDCQLATA
ncbi:transcriptional regulator [Nocardia uniformis]|uniref:Transcriptional regulator n=1 Tax=Nocardia uniformis TaxID=53432 RepID=A0A849CDS3_9NOCA|nr:transcriptional regulator [Nocardia uniformis]NNH71261.1 transcriptional regulator [Nocardia uniformis]